MNLKEEDLQMAEECGKYQMPVHKMAVVLQMNLALLQSAMQNENSDVFKRYNKGRLLAEFEVRKSIYNLAIQNSSQAQELWLKLRDELNMHEA